MPDSEDPPIREFADRGTKWLLDLPENLRGVLRLVEADLADRIDFDRAERVRRSFIPDDLKKLEADVVYRAPYRHGRGFVWIYLLLEQQTGTDVAMGFRVLCYMVQIWQAQIKDYQARKIPPSHRKLSSIIPIVLYTGKRAWRHEISLQALMHSPPELRAFTPSWETLFIDLQQTPPERLLGLGEAVLLALRALQAVEDPKEKLAEALREVAARLDALPETAKAPLHKALTFLYLLVRHKREAEEQDDLFAVLDQAVEHHIGDREEIKMTGAELLIRQGEAVGEARGQVAGRRAVLLAQIEEKFGGVPESVSERLSNLTSQQLDRLARRLVKAATIEELGLQG